MKARVRSQSTVIWEQRLCDHVISLGLGCMCEVLREVEGYSSKGRIREFLELFKRKNKEYRDSCHPIVGESKIIKMREKARKEANCHKVDFLDRDLHGNRQVLACAQDYVFILSTVIIHERWKFPVTGHGGEGHESKKLTRLFNAYNEKVRYYNVVTEGNYLENDKFKVSTADILVSHLDSIGVDQRTVFTICGYDSRLYNPRYEDCI